MALYGWLDVKIQEITKKCQNDRAFVMIGASMTENRAIAFMYNMHRRTIVCLYRRIKGNVLGFYIPSPIICVCQRKAQKGLVMAKPFNMLFFELSWRNYTTDNTRKSLRIFFFFFFLSSPFSSLNHIRIRFLLRPPHPQPPPPPPIHLLQEVSCVNKIYLC